MPTVKDLTGQIFGRWTVLHFDTRKNTKAYWLCKCQCGTIKSIYANNLIQGGSKSCGCIRIEHPNSQTHGMKHTRFYRLWEAMKYRCGPTHAMFKYYGAKGVTVCERWLKFENFRNDMYESYLEHVKEFGEKNTSLDRFPNVNGNYEPGNVRWATQSEQARNRRDSTISNNYKKHFYWKLRLMKQINDILRLNFKRSKIEYYLGCSISEFRQHIESQFEEGMTWSNHGNSKNTWQLDHIIGCNQFDLSKEEDRLVCFNYKNLRPLWWTDHIKKSKSR